MGRRTYMVTVAAGVIGLGLLWAVSNRSPQDQGGAIASLSGQVDHPEPGAPASDPVVAAEPSRTVESGVEAPVGAPSQEQSWPPRVLQFAEQPDPDPILAKYLEVEVRRLVDTTLDLSRYKARSVTCRGDRCQVLTLDQEIDPAAAGPAFVGPPGNTYIAPLLRGLSDAGIRSPTTGEDLKVKLESVGVTRSAPAGIEVILAFAN